MITFDHLVAGEIAWCRFPEKANVIGPKNRPVLILDVSMPEDGSTPVAMVAYGTSQHTDKLFAGEFIVHESNRVAFKLSGLAMKTKFSMMQTAVLPLTDEWFSVAPKEPYGYSPKLGMIHPTLMRAFQAAASAAGLI